MSDMPTFHIEIDEDTKEAIREYLSRMENPIELKLFTSKTCGRRDVNWCLPVEEFLDLLQQLVPDKLKIEKIYFETSEELFNKYGIFERYTPVICIGNCEIMYYGAPFGEEVRSFLETLIMYSTKRTRLKAETRLALKKLGEVCPKEIQILTVVTQACPYCPYAATLANSFAIESRGKIKSIIYDASLNPEIAELYSIAMVPAIIIKTKDSELGRVEFIGVPTEIDLLDKIMEYCGVRIEI